MFFFSTFSNVLALILSTVQLIEGSEYRSHLLNAAKKPPQSSSIETVLYMISDGTPLNPDFLTHGLSSKLDDILSKVNITQECENDLRLLILSARDNEIWALRVLNSWGTFPPSGIFSGVHYSPGSYEQCVQTLVNSSSFRPNYCTILFAPFLPDAHLKEAVNATDIPRYTQFSDDEAIEYIEERAHFFYYVSLKIGICLPNSCDSRQISSLARFVGLDHNLYGEVIKCDNGTSSSINFNSYRKVSLVIIIILIVLLSITTLIECCSLPLKGSKNLFGKILSSFSFKANFKSLLSTETDNEKLKSLNGMKVLTFSAMMAGNSNSNNPADASKATKMIKTLISPGNLASSLAMDSCFLISGLLTAHSMLSASNFDQILSPVMFVVSRFMKLTPVIAFAICMVFLLPYFGNSPEWSEKVGPQVHRCEQNWWVNLLHMQNFVKSDEMCMQPTGWLANDMLLHIISLPIVIPLIRSHRIGSILNSILIIIFLIISFINVYSYRDPPPTFAKPNTDQISTKPYQHGPSFLLGIYIGYLLVKGVFMETSMVKAILGWVLALGIIFSILMAPNAYSIELGHWPTWSTAILDILCRVVWCSAISWMIFAMVSGYGGWVESLLSHDIFGSLARTSYSSYISNMFVVWTYSGTNKKEGDSGTLSMVIALILTWLLSQIFGFLSNLLFEAPLENLLRNFFPWYKSQDDCTSKLTTSEEADTSASSDTIHKVDKGTDAVDFEELHIGDKFVQNSDHSDNQQVSTDLKGPLQYSNFSGQINYSPSEASLMVTRRMSFQESFCMFNPRRTSNEPSIMERETQDSNDQLLR